MNTRKPTSRLLAMLLVLQGIAGSAIAATPVLAPGAYSSGGISDESRQEMLATRELYNLQATFAEARTGAYVAGVTIWSNPRIATRRTVRTRMQVPCFMSRSVPASTASAPATAA